MLNPKRLPICLLAILFLAAPTAAGEVGDYPYCSLVTLDGLTPDVEPDCILPPPFDLVDYRGDDHDLPGPPQNSRP